MASLSKHRKSGKTSKSPKLLHRLKREAEQKEEKQIASNCKYSTIAEVLRGQRCAKK